MGMIALVIKKKTAAEGNRRNQKGGTYMASKKNIGLGVAAVAAAGAGAALAAKSLKKHANVGLEQGQVTQDSFDGEKQGRLRAGAIGSTQSWITATPSLAGMIKTARASITATATMRRLRDPGNRKAWTRKTLTS